MKNYKFRALSAMAFCFILISCNSNSSIKLDAAHPLVGKWRIDSVSPGKDSNLVYFMLLSSMIQDSLQTDFNFTKDTIFTYSEDDVDTSAYQFDEKKKQMKIADEPDEIYNYASVDDSTISLTANDGTILFLRKRE